MNIEQLIEHMESCEQSPGHTTLDHGVAVLLNMHDLINGTPRGPVPSWYIDHRPKIVGLMPPEHVWGTYAIYHDCAKFLVREVDEQGRQHFPGHAQASADLWLRIDGLTRPQIFGRESVAELMRLDMVMHTATAAELEAHLEEWKGTAGEKKLWSTLLISSIAELHANAPMFGGFESQSFKIKFKHVKRRGAQVCRALGLDA